MFIELSEFLRCPESHEDTFLVVAPDEMVGRMILRGIIGCPICKREYAIADGVVRFGGTAVRRYGGEGGRGDKGGTASTALTASTVWPLLGLTNPGGFVVLIGSATRLAAPLAEQMGGVHFVGINAPEDVEMSHGLTLLTHPSRVPLRESIARGVVVGGESAREPWLSEGTRVLLKGLRLVAAAERVSVQGLEQLAAGNGLWVGQKG
jgi:uncharacterized protein YbaR (Trm112 family)